MTIKGENIDQNLNKSTGDPGKLDEQENYSLEDSLILSSFSEYMQGRHDIEEVKNDPALSRIDLEVKEMVSDYNRNKSLGFEKSDFIRGVFSSDKTPGNVADEIKKIRLEINQNNINELTADWVKDWHKKRQGSIKYSAKTNEIKDFIVNSLEEERVEYETVAREIKEKVSEEKHSLRKSVIYRFISYSAAAVLATFLLIRTILPSSDTDKVFNSFYEPFNIASTVTRSISSDNSSLYTSAVDDYKAGFYDRAALDLSTLLDAKQPLKEHQFLMGLTQLELNNFELASGLLASLADSKGEYSKESAWYAGLAYLKTGNKEKAAQYFQSLTLTQGYYSGRAEDILRRLK